MDKTSKYIVKIYIVVSYMIFIYLFSEYKFPKTGGGGTSTFDPFPFYHLCEFGILSLLLMFAFYDKIPVSFLLIASISYGVLDEVHQYFVPHRYFDFKDIFHDIVGSIAGVIGFVILVLIYNYFFITLKMRDGETNKMKRKERKFTEKMLKEHPEEWFRCAQCEKIYKKEISDEWSDEIMNEEYKKKFPSEFGIDVPTVLICDDCYHKICGDVDSLETKHDEDLEEITEKFAERFLNELVNTKYGYPKVICYKCKKKRGNWCKKFKMPIKLALETDCDYGNKLEEKKRMWKSKKEDKTNNYVDAIVFSWDEGTDIDFIDVEKGD